MRASALAGRADRFGCPAHDRFQTRGSERRGLIEADPAPLVVLRPAERRVDTQGDELGTGLRQIVAGYLVVAVTGGLAKHLAPVELQVFDRRLFAHFTPGGGQRVLAGLDDALGEVPVAIGA